MLRLITEIEKKLNDMFDAFNKNETHHYEHFFTEDGWFVPPGKPFASKGIYYYTFTIVF